MHFVRPGITGSLRCMTNAEKLLNLTTEYQESCASEDVMHTYTREPEVIAAEYEQTLRAMLAS